MLAKPVRASIEFTVDEIEEFLECEVGYRVVCDEQVDSRRWHSVHWYVVERVEDATFWGATYERGLTEGQHLDRYERWDIHTYDQAKRDVAKVKFRQVFPKTQTITVYE